ncbi:unnamed protein product [Gulo gulo]|uniref:Methyltransferase domain-containing protein n=1 Tax=Gulo gulo TaxID=48420 RepID=A0A9X9PVP1_GULGU|nr:unnamed protein product [Gulo gulo]
MAAPTALRGAERDELGHGRRRRRCWGRGAVPERQSRRGWLRPVGAGDPRAAKFGFSNITGIDYSPSAIQLSGSIIEKEGLSNIKLKVEDFLNLSTKLSGFHICIDKGTFDAISLNPDNAIEKRKQYVKSLSGVLNVKGFFLITSCNWTKEELLDEFSEGFELFEELPTPKFSFGGRSGNSVTALVFQKT